MRLKALFPAGACQGTTKKGARCRQRDVYENMRCKHHGPQGELLRVKLRRESELKRLERWKRKHMRESALDRRIKKVLAANPSLRSMVERIRNAKNRSEDLARLGNVEGLTAKSPEGQTPDVRSKEPQGTALPVQKTL